MKLSIITINRNNKDGLLKTIESVVNQTFTDYEYLVVDGASTDGSVDVIKQYQDRITYWVSEPDKGIYNAMNKGILQAKGEYCLFLNSGDWLVNNDILSKVFCEDYASDILSGDIFISSGDQKEIAKSILYLQDGNVSLYSLTKKSLFHPATFIKKSLFDIYGLYNEEYRIVSDWLFFIEVIGLRGVSVEYIDCVISDFNNEGISSCSDELRVEEKRRVLSAYVSPSIRADFELLAQWEHSFGNLMKCKGLYLFARVLDKIASIIG